MDLVDRSAIPAVHAAARRHRAVYLGCLLGAWTAAIVRLFREQPVQRVAPCG